MSGTCAPPRWLRWALASAFSLAAGTAEADAPSSATAVILVQGTAGPATTATLEKLIAARVHVADRAAFLARAATEGAPRALTMPPTAKVLPALKKAAKHEHVDVVIFVIIDVDVVIIVISLHLLRLLLWRLLCLRLCRC